MVGFEFSRFGHHIPKKTPQRLKKGPKMESKWTQDPEKERPEVILDATRKHWLRKVSRKGDGELPADPVRAESRVWVPLIKEIIESQGS